MNTFRPVRRVAAAALLLGVAVGTTACDVDSLLEVEDRDIVQPDVITDPATISVAINGAIGNFQGAWGGFDTYAVMVGLFTDELHSTGTFPTRTATDRRRHQPLASGNTTDAAYNNLQFARRALSETAEMVAAHEDYGEASATYARLKALEGYTLIGLGEGFCSAVPLSNFDLETAEETYGAPQTSRQILDEAIERFDASLTGGHDGVYNDLASIGKARALLDQGHYAEAAAQVADVPTDYVYFVSRSESGGSNAFFDLQGNGRYALSDMEGTGGNTMPFRSMGVEYENNQTGAEVVDAGDGRSPWWEDPNGGFDASYDLYRTLLYNDVNDDIPLASGVEARLIEAEAALHASGPAAATAILNDLRADAVNLMEVLHEWTMADGLDDLPTATSFDEGAEQVFQERAMWLLLTGHRQGDLRRQIYLPEYSATSDDDVYPTGGYHKGGDNYGDAVVFPLDFDEENNPEFDHDMCEVNNASID